MARSRLSVLIRRCLHQRRTSAELESLLQHATRKWACGSTEIVAGFISAVVGFCLENDPLVSIYLHMITFNHHAKVPDFIAALCLHWSSTMESKTLDPGPYTKMLAQMITNLAMVSASTQVTTKVDARQSLIICSRWLDVLFRLTMSSDTMLDEDGISLLVNALGAFLITNLNTSPGLAALKACADARDDPLNTAVRQTIHASMTTSFSSVSMQFLSEAQKHPALDEPLESDSTHVQASEMAALAFENDIAIAQIAPTRLATYTLIHDKLVNASTIDENALYAFLQLRHASNSALMFTDLLFASLDTLTKSQHTEDPIYRLQCRIYLYNKLPAILTTICNTFQPLPTEQYLQELWNELQTTPHEEAIAVVVPFLHICILHQFIAADTVQTLTGSDQKAVVAKGLFSKQSLVDQVKANPMRGPRLVDELCKNDGNVGPFSQAIVEIMHGYVQAGETAHLKDMANAIVRQPTAINAMAMFVHPAYFLGPCCRLLDDWSWDDIHESQPVYEEFGSVLLLLMAFKSRLSLATKDLGLFSTDGFVAEYFSSGQSEKMIRDLTNGEKANLGEWIHNLFESEGINDELTSNCSAKEFYLMVPTLLRQSMTALAKGRLVQDKLEGGLDYLLEPFLLPSLLSSFAWLSQAVFKDQKNAMIIIRRLVKPPENTETNKLHRSILNIAREMFSKALSRHTDQQQAAEILALFGDASSFSVRRYPNMDELNRWMQQGGDIVPTFQQSLSDMLTISDVGNYQPMLLLAAIQLRGPEPVVHSILLLLTQFASNHGFPHLLDVVATIIASTTLPGVSLRNTLQLMHARLGEFVKTGEGVLAEALVHLYRRVEAYATAMIAHPGSNDAMIINSESVDLAEINLDQLQPETELPKSQMIQPVLPNPVVNESMDQLLTDAVTMDQIDDYAMNDDNIFDMESYDLANMDDLDMSMF